MNILTNALIAVAAVGVVGYALMSHLQSRPRPRARTGGDGGSDTYSDTSNEGFSLGSWFSSDSSGAQPTAAVAPRVMAGVEIAEAGVMVAEAGAATRPYPASS